MERCLQFNVNQNCRVEKYDVLKEDLEKEESIS